MRILRTDQKVCRRSRQVWSDRKFLGHLDVGRKTVAISACSVWVQPAARAWAKIWDMQAKQLLMGLVWDGLRWYPEGLRSCKAACLPKQSCNLLDHEDAGIPREI